MLTIQELVNANVTRCERDFKHSLNNWSYMEWAGAATFEFGEGGNIAKKIKRIDIELGNMNNPSERDRGELIEAMADEIADGIHYACLWAASAGIDLEDVLRRKFNKVSLKHGSPMRL